MTNHKVAKEILRQLGGNQFLMMTGCHKLAASENLLTMRLRRNKTACNYLKITLGCMDTYKMEFITIRKNKLKVGMSFDNIYCDQLQDIFTSVTGLYTRL